MTVCVWMSDCVWVCVCAVAELRCFNEFAFDLGQREQRTTNPCCARRTPHPPLLLLPHFPKLPFLPACHTHILPLAQPSLS